MNSAAAMEQATGLAYASRYSPAHHCASELSGIVLRAGQHHITSDVDDADVVIADGSIRPPNHPAVIRLGDIDDRESASALPKSASPEQIGAAIQAVAVGLSVRVRSARSQGFAAASDVKPEFLLTPREIEVLEALAEGLSNKAIARKLDISQHTGGIPHRVAVQEAGRSLTLASGHQGLAFPLPDAI